MKKEDDFILDILSRVRAAGVDLTDEVAIKLEREIRRDYGGDYPWIAKTEKYRDKNSMALEDLNKKMPMQEVAQKYGISRASMYRLLKKTKN